MIPIPSHLSAYSWYAPHQAWMKAQGWTLVHDPGEARESRAVLSLAVLSRAVLSRADLRGADLRGADLRGAYGMTPIPVVPRIDSAILAAIKAEGCALNMGDWHTCETTHCRAGWAVHLAGKAGYELEARVGPPCAGALIYAASRPGKPVPDFYESNELAMESIERDAAEENPCE